jgi:hypothetical protein
LKNEGQQFHQYQQNRQPPIASTHKYNNNKKTMTYGNENPCPGFGQAQKCGIIKPIIDGLVVSSTTAKHSGYVNMVIMYAEIFKTDVIVFICKV